MTSTKKQEKTTVRHAAQLTWGTGDNNQRITALTVRKITTTPNDFQGETGTSTVVYEETGLDVPGHQWGPLLASRGWDVRENRASNDYRKPYTVTVERNPSDLRITTARASLHRAPIGPEVEQTGPTSTDTGSTLIVGTSTEGDTGTAGGDDYPVIGTLYEHLEQVQRNLDRAERRAEQLRRERLTLAAALVDEGEKIAVVAARLGVSKQYLHKQLSAAAAAAQPKSHGEPMF